MPTIDFPSGVSATNPTNLVGGNATDPARAPVGATGLTLLASADATAALTTLVGQVSMAVRYSNLELFTNSVTSIGQGLAAANTGGTQAVQVVDGRTGVVRCSTGVAATADRIAAIASVAASSISLGFGIAKNAWVFAPALALPSGAPTGFIRVGFMDSTAAAESTDAVMFRVTNAGNYVAVCRSNNVETTVDTGVLPVLGTYVIAAITVNATATSALFELYSAPTDGSAPASLYSGSITTNIPTGAGRQLGHGISIHRVAATATALGLDVDTSFLGLNHPATLPF